MTYRIASVMVEFESPERWILQLFIYISIDKSMCLLAVDYEEVSGMTLNQRVALWLAADVFLLTPIREGLNLMPLVL